MNGYLSREQLLEMGFASVGEDVLISDKACFYGASKMRIGNHVRIDDFCLLVGNISIGNYIHICAYSSLHASSGSIDIGDYANLSSRTTIYAASDDYSGEYMTNPMVPKKFTHIIYSDITIGKHVIIGTGCSLLPGATIPEGCAIGAMSLVKSALEPWGIYAGSPCRKIKDRRKQCLELENQLWEEET